MRGGTEISRCTQSLQAAGLRCDGVSPRLESCVRPEFWLLVWVLLSGSGLCLWAPLLPTDKITSEVIKDCDPMHLPRMGDVLPGASYHPVLLLGALGPPVG